MLRSWLLGTSPRTPEYIFPTVTPEQDGPDCRRDCADCTLSYPSRVKIDTAKPLYGHIKEFSTHVLVGTGQSDWVEKVKKDKGSKHPGAAGAAPAASETQAEEGKDVGAATQGDVGRSASEAMEKLGVN